MATPAKTPITPKMYAMKVLDGMFSEKEINEQRKMVFFRVANTPTPKGNILGNLMSEDEIGDIINELGMLQFNRRLSAKMSRLQDQTDF